MNHIPAIVTILAGAIVVMIFCVWQGRKLTDGWYSNILIVAFIVAGLLFIDILIFWIASEWIGKLIYEFLTI